MNHHNMSPSDEEQDNKNLKCISNSDDEDDLKNKKKSSEDHDHLFGCMVDEKNVVSLNPASFTKSHGYQYDILFIYDADTDFCFAQDLQKQVTERNLSLLDFNRDRPAGVPPSTFFTEALKCSKYTCMIVSRNLVENLWLKFKADMAIQNMLQNRHKLFTLIVVVADMDLKPRDLPLELQTLGPIFRSERHYEYRLKNAFGGHTFGNTSNIQSSEKSSSVSDASYSNSPTMQYHSNSGSSSQPVQESHGLCLPVQNNVDSPTYPNRPASNYSPQHFSSSDFLSKPTSNQVIDLPSTSQYTPSSQYPYSTMPGPSSALSQKSHSFQPLGNKTSHTIQPLAHESYTLNDRHFLSLRLTEDNSQVASQSLSNEQRFTSLPPSSNQFPKKFVKKWGRSPENNLLSLPSNDYYQSHSDSEAGSSSKDSGSAKEGLTTKYNSDTRISTRVPQEHEDVPVMSSLNSADFQRFASATKPSTGLRQPMETDETAGCNRSSPNCLLSTQTSFPSEPFHEATTKRSTNPNKSGTSSPANKTIISSSQSVFYTKGEAFNFSSSNGSLKSLKHLSTNASLHITDNLNDIELEISEDEYPLPSRTATKPVSNSHSPDSPTLREGRFSSFFSTLSQIKKLL